MIPKKLYYSLLLVLVGLTFIVGGAAPTEAQATDLIISGVIDGPLSGGVPKAVEFYALEDIADLSSYGFGSANNGGGTDGEEFTFPSDSASAGDFIYVATEAPGFNSFFGFDPNYTNGTAPSINGDDAIELFQNGVVVDVFGEIDVDGSGQPWEYEDGWAYRNDGTGPDGDAFQVGNWSFSGPNALDGETTNSSAATPFPLGSYSPDGDSGGDSGQPLPLTENFDSCALTGWQIVSVDSDQANTWSCSEQFSNIQANGFGNAAPADEWLITPSLDMDSQDNEALSFRNYTDFSDVDYPQLSVEYSTDYDGNGDPNSATWMELSGITLSPEDSGQWVDSGNIDLSGIGGSSVYFAFHYVSSGTGGGSAALWRLDQIAFFVDDGGSGSEELFVHQIQGDGPSVTNPDTIATVEAVVTADHQDDDELNGFFIQEETADEDGNPTTSEGIFVYCGECPVDVAEGNIVEVTGAQEEFFAMSQIDTTGADGSIIVVDGGNNLNLVTPVQIDLPAPAPTNAEATFEAFEGMLVQFVDQLSATEYFQLGRFGQVVLSEGGRQIQFTDENAPSVAGYAAHLEAINRSRIILDDLNNEQNIDPVYHPQPGGFSVDNFFRGGYTVDNLTGVLHWSWAGSGGTDAWRVRPQLGNPVSFNADNPRSATPEEVGGDLKVAAFNVLNYFTTIDLGDPICGPNADLDCRGAHSPVELERQTDKIVAALAAIDADIVGLVELENNASASLQELVDALNSVVGAGTYDFVDTGTIGGDAIKVGFIYKPATVAPVGDFKILDSSVDPAFIDTKNRPVLIQTFAENGTAARLTVAVNHLKSKGSPCDDVGDPNLNDGQGNCNQTRTTAAQALVNYLATDPTGSQDPDFLILGDLNAYAQEDPITTIKAAGYNNLIEQLGGPDSYSFVFDGQWGYLDHALATTSLASQVTGVTEWHINSDEVNLLDYNDTVQDPAERSFEAKPPTNELYNPDPYRASDHDPVIVGLQLAAPVTTPMDQKRQAKDDLAGLLPTGDVKLDRQVEKVIERIDRSLDPDLWMTDSTLDPERGKRVFDWERQAVRELMRLAGGPLAAEAQAAIDLLVSADQTLAQTAIDEAIATGGHPQKIELAQSALAGAAEELANGRYDRAIIYYKKAWFTAIKAF